MKKQHNRRKRMAKEENKANWELTTGNRGQKDGIKVLPDGGYGFVKNPKLGFWDDSSSYGGAVK